MTTDTYHLNRLNMWGQDALLAYVYKRGRTWQVEIGNSVTPTTFPTKRDALRHAEARIYAMAGKWDWTPWMFEGLNRSQRTSTRMANVD